MNPTYARPSPKRPQNHSPSHSCSDSTTFPRILELPPYASSSISDRKKFIIDLISDLATQRFAVLCVPPELALDASACEELAAQFFDGDVKAIRSVPCARGNFCGYHMPSSAKEVFRHRFGLADIMMQHSANSVGADSFFSSVDAFGRKLHAIAWNLVSDVLLFTGSLGNDASELLDEIVEELPPSGLSGVASGSAPQRGEDQANKYYFPIPPFDVFHYFNKNDEGEQSNCEPHNDPGLLTLIPLANVPGLAVFQPCNMNSNTGVEGSPSEEDEVRGDWLAVEKCLHRMLSDEAIEEKTRRMSLVTVLAGEALESLTAGLVPAGLHRVERPLVEDFISCVPCAKKMSCRPRISPKTPCNMERYSLVFDLQVNPSIVPEIAAEAELLRARNTRREAQPPLHEIQRVAGQMARRFGF